MSDPKSHFRTTEILHESLNGHAFSFITVKSKALQGRGDISVFTPKGAETLENLPVIVLLHGVYGSHFGR